MALSPLKITMDDCGDTNPLETIVFSIKHAESLVGKYFMDINLGDTDWRVFSKDDIKKTINHKILLRSPMTCQAPNFQMCRKCFGTRNFPTDYVGITAAQCISERNTQLIMRSFHHSGSANLDIQKSSKDFMTHHLVEIEDKDDEIVLKFDVDSESFNYPESLSKIKGFKNITKNEVIFGKYYEATPNKDAVAVMMKVKNLLNTHNNPTNHPFDYYAELMSCILEVGTPYSSFIEMLFTNMFINETKDKKTGKKNVKFWRYNQNLSITKKLGDKTLSQHISKLLGLLYQPNKKSLEQVYDLLEVDIDNVSELNIYEKIFLGQFFFDGE